jgi:Lipocalin-like domain
VIKPMIYCLCLITVIAFFQSAAAEESIAKRIVGAWTLDAVTAERADGSKGEPFGPNPKGIIIFTDGGYFSLFQSRADLPKLVENDRGKATPEEAKAVVSGSIAYYGIYSVNETDKSLSVTLDGATFVNLLGGAQKRDITSLTDNELRFSNPRTPSGMTLQTVWRRAKAQ